MTTASFPSGVLTNFEQEPRGHRESGIRLAKSRSSTDLMSTAQQPATSRRGSLGPEPVACRGTTRCATTLHEMGGSPAPRDSR